MDNQPNKNVLNEDKKFQKVFIVKAKSLAILLTALIPTCGHSNIEKNMLTKSFSVKIGSSRVIYKEGVSSEAILIINPQDYPILVEGTVYSEDKKNQEDFIVTPPLIKLDGNQQGRLRIIKTEKTKESKQEKLHWICLKALPPKDSSDMNEGGGARLSVNLTLNTCNKLIYRPKSLNGSVDGAASKLMWSINGKVLKATNPTGFYININSIKLNNELINNVDYIPPFQSREFQIGKEIKNKNTVVNWDFINDYGGVSAILSSRLK